MAEEKRAWLYLRVGMTPEADAKLDRQKKDLLNLADQQGWTATEIVFDIGTGPKLTRPSIANLMHAAQESVYDILLINKTSSICKDRLQALSVLAAIQTCGVKIHCREEGAIDAVKESQTLRDQMPTTIELPIPMRKCCDAGQDADLGEGPALTMG